MAEAHGQQHPLSIYFWIWGLLFVFSAASYATDFIPDGYLRWALILLFMFLKAGFIVAIFMHMAWERLALIYAILGPPVVLLVLVGLMVVEGDYTELTRLDFFSEPIAPAGHEAAETGHGGAEAAH
jgi:cytochrome c oxidase subunit 4